MNQIAFVLFFQMWLSSLREALRLNLLSQLTKIGICAKKCTIVNLSRSTIWSIVSNPAVSKIICPLLPKEISLIRAKILISLLPLIRHLKINLVFQMSSQSLNTNVGGNNKTNSVIKFYLLRVISHFKTTFQMSRWLSMSSSILKINV